VDLEPADVLLLDEAVQAHARREHAARGVVDVFCRRHAGFDEVVGLAGWRAAGGDEEPDDRL